MGILKHLLFWPVTGPTFLARFSMEKVQDAVREELTDDQRIKEELLALQMQLELGEIDDDEYVAREADLMLRLREVRQWREEFGMGMAGGPVRVARTEASSQPEEEPPVAEPPRGGVASVEGASVELDFGWDEESR
ncbi:MAG TPA: gas vesicle protein GvpG [Longimicrobiaceae bacterium]|nr:gas vesicle protein GvpG [Longimicrobiaceae bacterium]